MHRHGRGLVLALVLAGTLSSGRLAAETPPRYFQCYEVRPPAPFERSGVSLLDSLGERVVNLRKAYSFCAPADVNGEDPGAVADPIHLTAYGLRGGGKFAQVRNLGVTNSFDTFSLDAVRPARLLVPSAKSLSEPPTSPVAGLLDHFTCYKVRRASGSGPFGVIPVLQVTTQFESSSIDLVRPRRLCLPVNKNGESPGAEAHMSRLLCYRTRTAAHTPPRVVFVANQFGQQQYAIAQRRELCVPSLVP